MNDRFKFRIYDKKLNKLSKWGDNPYHNMEIMNYICVEEPVTDWKHKDYVLMQCTGLKDKNGTLIYEGDIVEVQYFGGQIPLFKNEYSKQPETERFEIFCHPEWLKFHAKNDNYRKTCEIHSLDLERIRVNDYNKSYEVIGNIYENPELIKE